MFGQRIAAKAAKGLLKPSTFQMLKWMLASRKLVSGDSSWAKNAKYDIETYRIMDKVLSKNSNAIDVGASFGKFVKDFNNYSPDGNHFLFEALPETFAFLEANFCSGNLTMFNAAASNVDGETSFFVASNLGYSGLKATEDAKGFGDSREITVEAIKLDSAIPANTKIDFIKVDVEGAEYWVFQGAENLLRRDKPCVVFECQSHANSYDVSPAQIFEFLQSVGLSIWNTEYFLAGKEPYSLEEFERCLEKEYEFYFVAAESLVD